jgi:hypothetical protein
MYTILLISSISVFGLMWLNLKKNIIFPFWYLVSAITMIISLIMIHDYI